MRKAIIILACFMGVCLHSQTKVDNKITFHAKMWKKDSIYFFRPVKCIKFSMKPTLDAGEALSLLSDTESNFTADDYFSVGKIDMRMKIYLLPNVSLIFGSQFSGITGQSYTTGISIKIN